MSKTLKPCPFCGSAAVNRGASEPITPGGQHTNGPNWRMVGCLSCCIFFHEQDQVHLPSPKRAEACVERWNFRAPNDGPDVC